MGLSVTFRMPMSAHFKSEQLVNPFRKNASNSDSNGANVAAARAYWSRFSLSDALDDASSGSPQGPISTSTC